MNSTERAFSERTSSLIGKDAKVIVAFSGGCDSLALIALCRNTMRKDGITAVYVNHRLRDPRELETEIRLNRSNCEALGVNLVVRELDEGAVRALATQRGGGIEEAARILRYRVLEQERQRVGARWILTAHHKQDQAETILMRIANGSPSTTLSGIMEKDDARHLARPLLPFTREELEQYNTALGLVWSTDSTNADSRYSRNAVRNSLMPGIRAVWTGVEDVLVRLGEEAARLNVSVAQHHIQEGISLPYDLAGFGPCKTAERMAILFSLWDSVFPDRELSMTLVSRVLDAVADHEATGRDSTVGAGGGLFTLYHGKLYLTDPEEDRIYSSFRLEMVPGETRTAGLPGGLVLRCSDDAARYAQDHGMEEQHLLRMDSSLFNGQTVLRFAREGDKVRLKGGCKSVGRLLQDMGIPAVMRCRIPVLEDAGGICAVFGSWCGGRDRISVKFRTSLARNGFPLYIVSKG